MNVTFGIVHFDGRPVARHDLLKAAARIRGSRAHEPEYAATVTAAIELDGPAGIGCVACGDGPAATPVWRPFRHADSGVILGGALRLYDRPALERAMGLTNAGASRDSGPDTALLAEAYLRSGDGFPARVRGDFALALWDPRTRTVLLARDHLGCLPLYYARHGGSLAFASTMGGVLAMLDRDEDLDPEWVADLIVGHHAEPERAAYPGVRRVPAGHVRCERPSGSSVTAYWSLQPRERLAFADDRDYEMAFRDKLHEAVRIRLPPAPQTIGAELSGGLDSSAVAAIAAAEARGRGSPLVSFCHVLPDALLNAVSPYDDDRAWTQRLVDHARMERHVPIDAANCGILQPLRRFIELHGAPPLTYVGVMSDALYEQAAAQGARVLFSGFGGDEVVSGPAPLVLEAAIARGDWRLLMAEWKARGRSDAGGSRRALIRSLASAGLGRTSRRRTLKAGHADARERLSVLAVRADYAARWHLERRAVADSGIAASARSGADTHALERYRTQHAALAYRLESTGVAAAGQGVQYRYPLLDVPLLEYYHAVPDDQKQRAGWGRYLFRRSLDGLVPESIRWRTDKGGPTIPHNVARFGHDALELTALIDRSRRRPELAFVDFAVVDRQLQRLLEAADGRRDIRGTRWGRFAALLGILVYVDLRAGGWRP